MKRYEKFNSILNETDSPEIQAFDMIIAHIIEHYKIEKDLSWCKARYKSQVEWLNEELKV